MEQKKTSGFAIASLVLGIGGIFPNGFCIIFAILGVVFGRIAKSDIENNNQSGEGLATAGFICGIIGIVLNIFIFIFDGSLIKAIFP